MSRLLKGENTTEGADCEPSASPPVNYQGTVTSLVAVCVLQEDAEAKGRPAVWPSANPRRYCTTPNVIQEMRQRNTIRRRSSHLHRLAARLPKRAKDDRTWDA
jgi:hypothetical protein